MAAIMLPKRITNSPQADESPSLAFRTKLATGLTGAPVPTDDCSAPGGFDHLSGSSTASNSVLGLLSKTSVMSIPREIVACCSGRSRLLMVATHSCSGTPVPSSRFSCKACAGLPPEYRLLISWVQEDRPGHRAWATVCS